MMKINSFKKTLKDDKKTDFFSFVGTCLFPCQTHMERYNFRNLHNKFHSCYF